MLTTVMLDDAELDVATLADVVNGGATDPDVVSRLGLPIKPLAKVIAEIEAAGTTAGGYEPSVAYAAGISLLRTSQTVEYLGDTYAPLASALPFVTGSVFDPTKWKIILARQLVTRAQMKGSSPSNGDMLLLVDGLKTGPFIFTTANVKTICDADTTEGLYIKLTGQDGSTGAFVRVVDAEYLSTWWGVTTQGGIGAAGANTTAYNVALATLAALSFAGFGYALGGARLRTPAGHYYFSGSLSPESAVDNYGDSTGWGNGTIMELTNKLAHLFNLLGWDGASRHAAGSKVHGFHLKGKYAAPADRGPYHGVYVNCVAEVYDLFGELFPGSLIYCWADAGSTQGNANGARFRNVLGQTCDWTLKLEGADANGCTIVDVNGISNRFGSIFDHSFLGNHGSPGISEDNGFDTNFLNRCHQGGHIYAVIYGQEVWCSTNAPPATATSNTGWMYISEGSAAAYQPTWVTGQTWYFAASVAAFDGTDSGNSRAAYFGGYVEGGQNPPVMGLRCTFVPAANTTPIRGVTGYTHGGTMKGISTSMEFPGNVLVDGSLTVQGSSHYLGPSAGSVTDTILTFQTTNTIQMAFQRYNSDGSFAAADGYFLSIFGTLYLNGATSGVKLRSGGGDIAIATGAGLLAGTDNTLTLGGASNRWSQLYAGTATISTSDERLKEQIRPVDDAALDVWAEVDWCSFKFIHAVEDKGAEKARNHTGLIAQRIQAAFAKHELDAFAYGLLCHDVWDDVMEPVTRKVTRTGQRMVQVESAHPDRPDIKITVDQPEDYEFEGEEVVLDEQGEPVMRLAIPAGDRFGVRYEEALAMEAAFQRRRAGRVEERLAAIEKALQKPS